MSILNSDPPTRPSLLVRIRDARDEEAWSEFTAVYEPVIYRMTQRRGLQDADAREVVQEVLMSVAKAIDRFDLEAGGSFRGWLSRITRNAAMDRFRPLIDDSVDNESGFGRLDHYHVQGVIGQGGMGVVLRGIDPELNRGVAIKVLSPHLAGVGAARARFMREAQAAAAIVHPSIVPIYSVVTQARLPYIVMPCIQGGNLQQRIDREGPLDLTEVLRIGLQIAEGLSAAHRHGVIHRDIKPANILIEEGSGRVLISDFGLARALDDATLTNSGMIAGTPQYMSPEQARGEPLGS
jgi:RNA polymerase sigma factor (sigma-70 family)